MDSMLSSLPPDLLCTNRPPNDAELASARAILPYFEDELVKLCPQIAEAEARLNKLKSARKSLKEKKAVLQSVISPIRHVPRDIICRIFEYCLDHRSFPTMSHRDAPILLTHISSGLRKIALAMPTLWTTVAFNIEIPSRDYETLRIMTAQLSGIEDWLLCRSGSLPLNLAIHYKDNFTYTKKEEDLYYKMVDVVISCRSRWRDINLSLDKQVDATLLQRILLINPDSLPLLRSLTIKTEYGSDKIADSRLDFMPILTCPSLKSIAGFRLNKIPSPMSNLTYLETFVGESTSSLDIATALRQCTSLVHLDLEIWVTYDNPDEIKLIELPELWYLKVYEQPSDHHSLITQCIRAPSLQHFIYKNNRYNHISIRDFLERAPNITELRLLYYTISIDPLIEALRYCPQLVTLTLPLATDQGEARLLAYDKLLTRLVDADNTGDIICPKLAELRCMRPEDDIPILHFNTLQAFVMRKNQVSHNLATWKNLKSNIRCKEEDGAAVKELLKQCDRYRIRLRLSGYIKEGCM